MTERSRCRARRAAAWPSAVALLLMLAGTTPLQAAPADVVRSVLPVVTKGHPLAYDISLYSGKEFPIRDEVVTLSIGGRQFINSHYLQGGTLNTIVFRLSQREYQSLKSGDPMVVYYGMDDANMPSAQWNFGRFRPITVRPSGLGAPRSSAAAHVSQGANK